MFISLVNVFSNTRLQALLATTVKCPLPEWRGGGGIFGKVISTSCTTEKLDGFIERMEALRVEAIETNLHKPKAYQIVGDKDNIGAMTWRKFLFLQDN